VDSKQQKNQISLIKKKKEAEYDFSGFIPTNKQTDKQRN